MSFYCFMADLGEIIVVTNVHTSPLENSKKHTTEEDNLWDCRENSTKTTLFCDNLANQEHDSMRSGTEEHIQEQFKLCSSISSDFCTPLPQNFNQQEVWCQELGTWRKDQQHWLSSKCLTFQFKVQIALPLIRSSYSWCHFFCCCVFHWLGSRLSKTTAYLPSELIDKC